MAVVKDKIEMRKTESLIPYENNAKKHPMEQVNDLAASILQDGFDQPIVIRSDGTIIKGHGRLLAAKQIGLLEVPCIVNDLELKREKTARIFDNRVAETGWDYEKLRFELVELKDAGVPLEDTGFKLSEIADLEDSGDGEGDDESGPSGDGGKKSSDDDFMNCPNCGVVIDKPK